MRLTIVWKVAIVAAIVVLGSISTVRGTDVSGTISSDRTWTLVDSPYRVTANVEVLGATLTIEAGVEVRFMFGTRLLIGGSSASVTGDMIADGNAGGSPATITFTSDELAPAPGDWRGIAFRAGAGSTSIVRNAVVEYAGMSYAAVHTTHQNGTIRIEDVVIENIANDGLYVDGELELIATTIRNVTGRGIYWHNDPMTVSNCAFDANGDADIFIRGVATVSGSVTNCTGIREVEYSAVSADVSWSGNTFEDWGAVPSRIPPDEIDDFGADNTFNKAAATADLMVLGGNATLDSTWRRSLADRYLVESAVTIRGDDGADSVTTVTIEPGTTVSMAYGSQFTVGTTSASVPGALIADGNAGGPETITFTSSAAVPAAGDWYGVWYSVSAHGSSVLRNVRVEYGGRLGYGGVYATHDTGTITVDDVVVEHSTGHGLYVDGDMQISDVTIQDAAKNGIYWRSGITTIDGCAMSGVVEHSIYIYNIAVQGSVTGCTGLDSLFYWFAGPDIDWSGNTFDDWGTKLSRIPSDDIDDLVADNTINRAGGTTDLEVHGGVAVLDSTWTHALGDRYLLRGGLTIEGTDGGDGVSTITVEPGMEIRMPAGGGALYVGGSSAAIPGALVADGNAGTPATIVFQSGNDTPAAGDWYGVIFRAGSGPTSILRNAVVRHAGTSGYGAVHATNQNPAITIEDVLIEHARTYGLYVDGDLLVSGLTVQNTGNYGVFWKSDSMTLSDCTVQSGGSFDFYIGGGTTDAVGSVTNCAHIESVYYSHDSPEVTWSGNTFQNWGARTSRLEPDVVGEFISDNTVNAIGGAIVEVAAGDVLRDATWDDTLGNPYRVVGRVQIQGTDAGDGHVTLTIAPGIEMRFTGAGSLYVGANTANPGALIADGEAAGGPATIVFTSDQAAPAAGDWPGISFVGGAQDNSVLRNVRIEFAGGGGKAGVWQTYDVTETMTFDDITIVDSGNYGMYLGGPFVLSNCTIGSNDNHDLYFYNVSRVVGSVSDCDSIESVWYAGRSPRITWDGNTFDAWGARTSRITDLDADAFSHGNTFNPIPGAHVDMAVGTLGEDASWTSEPGPYEIASGNLSVYGTDGGDGKTTLRLDPGVTIRFRNSTRLIVGTNSTPGELIADGRLGGSAADVVNLTSINDVPAIGDWLGVRVDGAGRLELYETQVRYAATAVTLNNGTVGAIDGLYFNRVNVGLDLVGGVLETGLNRIRAKNTGVAVRTANVSPVIRNSDLVGLTWGVQNTTPATTCVDATENWWGATDGPDPGTCVVDACVSEVPTGAGSPITEAVQWANFLDIPDDDGDGVPADSGAGYPNPCTGGQTENCDDNCPIVANASQADEDGDGVGDACDGNPVLRVSSDPADGADFEIVQDAIDAAFESGTTVEILTGLGPYLEPVRVDRAQVFTFLGVENGFGDPVVVDGGSGPAFRVIDKVGTRAMEFRDFTLRGDQGVRTAVDTDLQDIVFDSILSDAMQLDAGSSAARRISIAPMAAVGARVADGASLDLRVATMTGLTDAGLILDGDAVLENVLIAGGNGADGVRMAQATASLDATFVTIADNTGAGVDNAIGGAVTVDRSVLWGNSLDDLVNVGCGSVTWSLTATPDCSGGGDNVTGDPMLDTGYHQTAGSPCLDHGPDPALYTGDPPTDAAGDLRLRDYDGDGSAATDCGAFEERDTSLVPGEVVNLRWDFDFRILWDAEPDAVEYHVYRDLRSNLSYSSFGVCGDGLDADRTDTQLDDLDEPAPGAAFIYLITADDGIDEGTLGFGSSAERSNFAMCP